MKLVVHGAPRTKKTSNRTILTMRPEAVAGWLRGLLARGLSPAHLMRAVLGRVKVHPSKAYEQWVKTSRYEFPGALALSDLPLPDQEYNCRAVFYRDRAVGDTVGFMQGLADLLETKDVSPDVKGWRVLSNDKWIRAWDGTRLAVDRDRPRVEVELTPLVGTTGDLFEEEVR